MASIAPSSSVIQANNRIDSNFMHFTALSRALQRRIKGDHIAYTAQIAQAIEDINNKFQELETLAGIVPVSYQERCHQKIRELSELYQRVVQAKINQREQESASLRAAVESAEKAMEAWNRSAAGSWSLLVIKSYFHGMPYPLNKSFVMFHPILRGSNSLIYLDRSSLLAFKLVNKQMSYAIQLVRHNPQKVVHTRYFVFDESSGVGMGSDEGLNQALEIWVRESEVGENREEAAVRIRALDKNRERELDLSGLSLRSLPDVWDSFKELRVLNLSHNNLERLPQGLIHLQNLSKLDLSYNPSSLQSSKELWDFFFLRFTRTGFDCDFPFMKPQHVDAYEKLILACRRLFSDNSLPADIDVVALADYLIEHKQNPNAFEVLREFFKGIQETRDYIEEGTRAHTIERTKHILQGFASHPSFLKATIVYLLGRTVACTDEKAMTFSAIETLRQLHCTAPNAGLEELAQILIGNKRTELVDKWALARSVAGSRQAPDGGNLLDMRIDQGSMAEGSEVLEASLALRLFLNESLGLQIATQSMQFECAVEDEIGPLEEAAGYCKAAVLERTQVHHLLSILMENATWKDLIIKETEAEWLTLFDQDPLLNLNDFLSNCLEQGMRDADKVACLAGTGIELHLKNGELRPLVEIQADVHEKMKELRYGLLLDKSCAVLQLLGEDGSDKEAIRLMRASLIVQDRAERVAKQKAPYRNRDEEKR